MPIPADLTPAESRLLREAAKTRAGDRVYFKDLRRSTGLSKDTFDRAVLKLSSREFAVPMRLGDFAAVGSKDAEAALTVAGNPRHFMYLTSEGQSVASEIAAKFGGGGGAASARKSGSGGASGG